MSFKKIGLINFLNTVVEKLKDNWIGAICSSAILAFLVFAVTNLLGLYPIVGIPLIGFALIGEIAFIRKLLAKEKYKLEDIFNYYQLFIPAFLTTALMLILIALGFVLLIIPGVIMLLNYSFALHVLEDNKELGSLEALKQSKKLSSGYKFKIGMFYIIFLALSAIAFGFGLLVSLILGLIWNIGLVLGAILVFYIIAILFINPLFFAGLTMFYDEIKKEDSSIIIPDNVEVYDSEEEKENKEIIETE